MFMSTLTCGQVPEAGLFTVHGSRFTVLQVWQLSSLAGPWSSSAVLGWAGLGWACFPCVEGRPSPRRNSTIPGKTVMICIRFVPTTFIFLLVTMQRSTVSVHTSPSLPPPPPGPRSPFPKDSQADISPRSISPRGNHWCHQKLIYSLYLVSLPNMASC